MSEGGGRLWGGRFSAAVDEEIDAFTRSLPFDYRLARFDLVGCLAHARMLFECGLLKPSAASQILGGLSDMLTELDAGRLEVTGEAEDVHTWIEQTLIERVGDDGRRLHTGRSRNDQTAVALRLWLRSETASLLDELRSFAALLVAQAEEHLESFLPGYTHLQRGQPVSLAHHLLAHFWALDADADRFTRVFNVASRSPLGAGALAGTPLGIDPHRTAALLGMERPYPNSMWAVADRDYLVEASFACALLLVHLSRWAEEVVLWSTTEFGFVELSDAVAKGSSLMPQKKNPEPAELLRGKSGRVVGDLVAHLVQLKGLPLTYNSDLQEDKEALFDAMETARRCLRAAAALARGIDYRVDHMSAALERGFVTATDLADALVVAGVPFRTAHAQAGAAVKAAEALGVELWQLSLDQLQEHCPVLGQETLDSLEPTVAVRARLSYGAPAPERVREQLALAHEALAARPQLGPVEAPILRAHLEGRLLETEGPVFIGGEGKQP